MASLANNHANILWTQRVEKELAVFSKRKAGAFSVHSAVMREEVPLKFKPGHMGIDDFKLSRQAQGFDPERNGWDPLGKESKQFRKCMQLQNAQPREHIAFPETTAQMMGWNHGRFGDPDERVPRKPARNRIGLGWGPPSPSAVTPAASALAPAAPSQLGVGRSELSRSLPALRRSGPVDAPGAESGEAVAEGTIAASTVSATAPSQLGWRSLRPNATEDVAASTVSAVAPSQIGSRLSRASTVPSGLQLTDLPAWLRHREAKLSKRLEDLKRYAAKGDLGQRHSYPLGSTDATEFSCEFCKATGGIPLHKYSRGM